MKVWVGVLKKNLVCWPHEMLISQTWPQLLITDLKDEENMLLSLLLSTQQRIKQISLQGIGENPATGVKDPSPLYTVFTCSGLENCVDNWKWFGSSFSQQI